MLLTREKLANKSFTLVNIAAKVNEIENVIHTNSI